MAQDLFFIPLDEGKELFDRKLVTGILGRGASEPVTGFECRYPDGSGGEVDGISGDTTQTHLDHLGFTHFGGRMLFERIYELADTLDVFLAWSDADDNKPNACVTRAERIDRISAEAKAALTVAVARDASHLSELVKGISVSEEGS